MNLVGVIKVSDVYTVRYLPSYFSRNITSTFSLPLTKNIVNLFLVFPTLTWNALCVNPSLHRVLRSYVGFIQCALFGGALGEATRAQMDKLMNQYNERLIKIAKEYQAKHYSDLYAPYACE